MSSSHRDRLFGALRPGPAVDEWGIYDPKQAGLEALFARLDRREREAAALAELRREAERQTPVTTPVPIK